MRECSSFVVENGEQEASCRSPWMALLTIGPYGRRSSLGTKRRDSTTCRGTILVVRVHRCAFHVAARVLSDADGSQPRGFGYPPAWGRYVAEHVAGATFVELPYDKSTRGPEKRTRGT